MRLIDANALLDWINRQRESTYRALDVLIVREQVLTVQSCLNNFEHEIKEQSTAYDVDKVVKQLDEKSFLVATSKEFYDNPQDGENVSDVIEISDAIEIVKGGGIDE